MSSTIPNAHSGDDQLLRVADIALRLQISKRRAFQLLHELPTIRIGRRTRRVRRADLEAWVNSRREAK